MKLKTLKELQFEYEWKLDTYNAVRQEAINWIKDIDNNIIRDESNTKDCPICNKRLDMPGNQERLHTIGWIKHFFNITEEYLK